MGDLHNTPSASLLGAPRSSRTNTYAPVAAHRAPSIWGILQVPRQIEFKCLEGH